MTTRHGNAEHYRFYCKAAEEDNGDFDDAEMDGAE